MSAAGSDTVLVLNSGSSSLKAGLFAPDAGTNFAGERPLFVAQASGIGQGGGKFSIHDASGQELASGSRTLPSQEEALDAVAEALREHAGDRPPFAVGHRIVHGGPRLREHRLLTDEVLRTLENAIHFAPLHLPASLALIAQAERQYPEAQQVVCFDTTFHQTMSPVAKSLPVPAEYATKGVERYGFHGLSYESLVAQLREEPPLPERIVLAHLGSGSSLCAVLRGKSIDTTMGLTPSGGVVMATRTGDLDPGVLFFLGRAGHLSIDALEKLVNHDAGLAALSGGTGDMQHLEQTMGDREASTGARAQAALAFDSFAVSIAKAIAGLVVSLHGLDLLVFAGGIGEHSASLRAAVLERLTPYGFRLNPEANGRHAAFIHTPQSKVPIRILPAEEDLVISAHTRRLCT